MRHTKLTIQADELSAPLHEDFSLIVPFDFVLDDEYRQWLPDNTTLYVARTPRLDDPSITIQLAKEVSDASVISSAVGSLLATRARAIGYACTSGSFVGGRIGELELQNTMLRAGSPDVVTTSGALLMALKELDINNLAIVTPYNKSLTKLLVSFLEEDKRHVVYSGYLGMESGISSISYSAIRRIAKAVDNPQAEAIFFSCTNLHTFEVIEQLEAELGKPVLSANQVTAWALLKVSKLPFPEVNQLLFKNTSPTHQPRLAI